MTDPEAILQLVDDIYDAALNPTLWVSVLQRATHFMGGTDAILYSKNLIVRGGQVHYRSNPDPSASVEYFTKYIKLDSVTVGQ